MAHPLPRPASPIRPSEATVRGYTERLFHLIELVKADPLSEELSLALVTHILNGRELAARIVADLHNATGSMCF